MQIESFSGLSLVCSGLAFVVGVVVLWRAPWFRGWLRGCCGLLCLALAAGFAIVALNVNSYDAAYAEQAIATISFEQQSDQRFDAIVFTHDGHEQRYSLGGDLWQLDAKIIKWRGLLRYFGVKTAYQLDRIQGRYYSLEQERAVQRTVYALTASPQTVFDLWQFAHQHRDWFAWVDAHYGSATYLPMADGAIFSVTVSDTGLLARPVNERAINALSQWQR